MRPVSAWLQRFRQPAGVPAAVGDEVESELMPVFATLDEIEEEARALREKAEAEVARRLDAAAIEVERILARSDRQAEVERIRAETEHRHEITSKARSIEREAQAEAERVRERGLEQIPALVASLIACLEEKTS